ncbi:MAG: hypothetical protein AAF719_03425 [Pseudomonadota bacterium]
MIAAFHLAEETFTLHFLFKRFQRLVDVVVAYDDLNDGSVSRKSRNTAGRLVSAACARIYE